jgi:tyrosine-protein kinase Etk/Wzc
LRYTTPQYEVVSTILIQDKENESISSEENAFEDLKLVSNSKSQFETEIGILKSRGLMEKVIEKLELNKIYLARGQFKNSELYGSNLPFKINFFGNDSLIFKKDTLFSVLATSENRFDLLNSQDLKVGSHLFGANIESDIGDFTVTPTNIVPAEIGVKVNVIIKPIEIIADSYRLKMVIEAANRKSSLINMSLKDVNAEKAYDILKALLQQYIGESIADKSLIAENTDTFIGERIEAISKELALVDNDAQFYLSDNNLTDVEAQTNLILSSDSSLEKEILDLKTQLKLTGYVSNYINNNSNNLIPTNLGLSGASLNESTLRYNEILQERNRLLQSSTSRNPVVINLDNQVNELKQSIVQSLENLKSTLSLSLTDLKRQAAQLSSQISSVPQKERELTDIKRQQETVETLYLYLLQKREENAIALAVKTPNAKLIDKPYVKPGQASPRRLLVFLIAGVAGLIIPFVILYVLFLVDNKIHSIDELESKLNLPILGGIPRYKGKNKFLISEVDTNSATEAFRVLRTNINFELSKTIEGSKTVFVTSTIAQEGKTLTSINLAKVLSMSSNKVLLIDGDIRNPNLAQYLKVPIKEGLSNYLADDSIKVEDLIEHVSSCNFDILQSGTNSTNPPELFMNSRFDKLLAYAKLNYDYIIIDTAPVNTVTDTLVLCKDRADLCVFVIRAKYLDKRMLKIVNKLYESGKLQNLAAVLNDISSKGLHGYTSDDDSMST